MRIILLLIGSFVSCLSAVDEYNITINVKDRTLKVTVPSEPEVETLFVSTDINDDCFSNYTFLKNSKKNDSFGYTMDTSKVFQKDDSIKMFGVFESKYKLETKTYNFKIDDNGNGVKQVLTRPDFRLRPENQCTKSKTIVNNKTQDCWGQLIFNEDFDDPTLSNWTPDIRVRVFQKATDREYVAYVDHKENIYINNSNLYLTATRCDLNKKTEIIKTLERIQKNCTSKKSGMQRRQECGRLPQIDIVIPPVLSAKINGKEKFHFQYGRVEIRARMPQGDWLFPYLILQPVDTYSESANVNHIRIAYARGNEILQDTNSVPIGGKVLFGSAVLWSGETHKEYINAMRNHAEIYYSKEFHIYTVIWLEDRIIFKVDGLTYGTITNKDVLDTFNKNECFIVLGLTAGGEVNFRDNYVKSGQKSFKNEDPKAAVKFREILNKTSWIQPNLVIDYVRVYTI